MDLTSAKVVFRQKRFIAAASAVFSYLILLIDGMEHAVRVTDSSNGNPTQVESKSGIELKRRTSPSSAWNDPPTPYYFSRRVQK